MNSKVFVLPILFLALSLSFVYAADSKASEEVITKSDVQLVQAEPRQPVEDMSISLVSPKNEKVFELSAEGESIDLSFEFKVDPMHQKAVCTLNVWGTNDYALKTELKDSGEGVAIAEFKEGEYKWNVECKKQEVLFKSEEVYYFQVKVIEIPTNTNTNTNTNTGNGGSSSNDEESNGRRLQPISLPLQELSTEADDSSEEGNSSPGITGAVIGALGNKGTLGIIVLVVVLGVAGLVIYNRRKLGVVKASK